IGIGDGLSFTNFATQLAEQGAGALFLCVICQPRLCLHLLRMPRHRNSAGEQRGAKQADDHHSGREAGRRFHGVSSSDSSFFIAGMKRDSTTASLNAPRYSATMMPSAETR